MATPSQFQTRRGTVAVTFTQGGTYSNSGTMVDMGGMRLVGAYSDTWPGAAGSVTFRSSWNQSGTGWPVQSEGGVPLRINPFGSAIYYTFGAGSVPVAVQYVLVQVDAGGTAGIAAGGTIVLVGEVN